MTRDPRKLRQQAAVARVKALSHLFDPDPEHPDKISPAALALPLPEGLSSRSDAVRELDKMLDSEFTEVRRLAASALGKMAPENPAWTIFLTHLLSVAVRDAHPQVRQYAVKALARYPEGAIPWIVQLKDIAGEDGAPQYLRATASEVVALLEMEKRERLSRQNHWCTRCRRIITKEEYFAGMNRWGKPYCRHCLDEREMEHVNFEMDVEKSKTRRSMGGTAVQSIGEKRIADFLEQQKIRYYYDERYRIAGDTLIRPDFYLPEFDLYIEYFGMNTEEYRQNMFKKRILYQRSAKKLISLSYRDDDRLIELLKEKLARYLRL